MDLGPHAAFIWACYGIVTAVSPRWRCGWWPAGQRRSTSGRAAAPLDRERRLRSARRSARRSEMGAAWKRRAGSRLIARTAPDPPSRRRGTAPSRDSPPRDEAASAGIFARCLAARICLRFRALRTGDPSKLPSALIGKSAPDIALTALEGLTDGTRPVPAFGAADLAAGHVSVVNFWASWCVPCVQEHPLLVALKEQTGVRLYGVNYKDQPAAARRFLGRYGNPFAAVGADANGRAAIEWGVYGMPETFVVNGKGQIVYKHVGPISAEALETRIIPAIRAAEAR